MRCLRSARRLPIKIAAPTPMSISGTSVFMSSMVGQNSGAGLVVRSLNFVK